MGCSEKSILQMARLAALGGVSLTLLAGCQSSPSTLINQGAVVTLTGATELESQAKIVRAIVRRDTVLFGEVHDNPAQHALRAKLVGEAIAQGARPAMAFEQFDRNLQPRIDAVLANRPKSAEAFLAELFPPDASARPKGWQWPLYAPLIDIALKNDLPIVAANLSRADAIKVSMSGVDAVFDAPTKTLVGLDRTIAMTVRDEQRRAIKEGHCNALSDEGINAMANAQLARDALLAQRLLAHLNRGVILFAGNGHTRRDAGVGYWLRDTPAIKFTSIGLLERGDSPINNDGKFDIVLTTNPHPREDPCIAFRARKPQ